jgi:hypothetical protein
MADFSIPTLPQITPPPQMSLGDMINTARAAQAYQQAAQVNPLDLQAKQMAIEQASKLNPLAFEQQAAQTQTAQQGAESGAIGLAVTKQKNDERLALQQAMSSGQFLGGDGKIDLDKYNAIAPRIAPLTYADFGQTLSTLSKAQTDASSAKQNLNADQRAIVGQRMAVLGRAGIQDKDQYLKEMDLIKQENPNNTDLAKLIDSYKIIWQTSMPSGPQLPDIAIRGAQSLLTPAQQQTFAPTIQTDTSGRTVTTTPGVGANFPTSTMGFAGGMQGGAPVAAPGAPIAAGTQIAPGMRVPYPVRSAAQPYVQEPTEAKDQAAGADYRTNLVNAQMGLTQGRRNVQEVMDQATKIGNELYFAKGGIPGQVEQKIRMAIGSDQYDMLAKDLANMAITNSKAMGNVGGTVAGLDMAAVANGTIKVPPDVLIKIARRVQADQTNLDMQANGAQQFSQKFGDNNMKAYQQAWNANADSKIFEAMNITRDITDPAKLKTELNRLFPNPNEYQDFLKKYRNIKKLSETGSL